MIGRRRYRGNIKQHDGTVDTHGNPTYSTAGDWDTVVEGWPCEILSVSANERLAGTQLNATTTHLIKGEYYGAQSADSTMKVEVEGATYHIIAAYDPTGLRREMHMEAKRDR